MPATLPLTIAGDKITEAKYTELMPKTKDNYSYPTAVDAVSQASGTSTLFKEAATAALELARNK